MITTRLKDIFTYTLASSNGMDHRHTGIDVTQWGLRFRGALDRSFMVIDTKTGTRMLNRDAPELPNVGVSPSNDEMLTISLQGKQVTFPLAPSLNGMPVIFDHKLTGNEEKCSVTLLDSHVVKALDIGDDIAETLSDFLGRDARLVRVTDETYQPPILVASQASLDKLIELSPAFNGARMTDLRVNLVISGSEPFAEDTWQELQIGRNVTLETIGPCDMGPAPDELDSECGPVADTLGEWRCAPDQTGAMRLWFGRGFTPVAGTSGKINPGDPVTVTKYAEGPCPTLSQCTLKPSR